MFAVALLAVHAAGFGCAISRVGSDGTNNVKLVSVGANAGGLGLNLAAGKLYWSEKDDQRKFMGIRHANLDGSGVGDTVSSVGQVGDLRVDSAGTYIYFTEGGKAGAVRRFNIHTGKVDNIVANEPGDVIGLDIDEVAGKVYWVQSDGEKVRRADFNGSNIETILQGYPPLNCPIGIALDGAGKMYITDIDYSTVASVDINGKGKLTTLIGYPNVDEPGYISIDKAAKKMYYAENQDGVKNLGIFRANLDGTHLEPVIAFNASASEAPEMQGVDVDGKNGHVYYIACHGGGEQKVLMV